MAMSMCDRRDKNRVTLQNIGYVTRKNGAIDAPIPARPLSPEKWISLNGGADVKNLVSESLTESRLARLVEQDRLA
jgi:hypothetical protein